MANAVNVQEDYTAMIYWDQMYSMPSLQVETVSTYGRFNLGLQSNITTVLMH